MTLLLSGGLGLATLGFLAYARRQESAADRRTVELTDKPAALARALAKIHRTTTPNRGLFSILYTHDQHRDQEWLSTHPPIQKRIERLLERTDSAVDSHYVGRIRP